MSNAAQMLAENSVRELTVNELQIVAGGNIAKPFPWPIPNPSPTFPPLPLPSE
jgi:hypothetical protein